MSGLKMKYFVLRPGKYFVLRPGKDDWHGRASRLAMKVYADFLRTEYGMMRMADDIDNWVKEEEDKIEQST